MFGPGGFLFVMITAEQCRRNADEAEEAAKQCRDIEAKRLFREMAEEWRAIANLRERSGL